MSRPLPLRTLLTPPPPRSLFSLLSHFATSSTESLRLLELASAAALDDYIDYCVRPRRTVAEVLGDFGSLEVPLEVVCEMFGVMGVRWFSIAGAMGAEGAGVGGEVGKVEGKEMESAETTGVYQ